MTVLTDFIATIRDWIDDQDPSDALITTWVRDAEARLNDELRSIEQISRIRATMDDDCVPYPPDWLEVLYVRLVGGGAFTYVTPDGYWQLGAEPQVKLIVNAPGSLPPYPSPNTKMVYTTIGRTLFLLPSIDPDDLTKIEVAYFRKIEPMGDTADPVVERYPALMRNCTLAAGSPYLVEDERLSTWAALATAGIAKANDAAKAGRWSGSPLTPVIKGFG